jgi:hypothetical protein
MALAWTFLCADAHGQVTVSERAGPASFRLDASVAIVTDARGAELIGIAARDLADDIGRVTGKPASVSTASSKPRQLWVGTPGQHAGIDALIASGRLDASRLANCWECHIVAVVSRPAPGIASALVVAGSDRRGAAFGVYDLSQAIGVSPWHWWADVAPLKRTSLNISVPAPYFSKPSVRYRGIFINDEDWGLVPWAAKTFDPATGNLGPKTYEEVFRLLLRLKANTLWPAMHKVALPFNANPDNARLAQKYGIVMGSSHAEPLLRNNVGEWKDAAAQFNYAINPDGVRQYWSERLKTNAGFESMYTLGMRGIHDSAMLGARTLPERQALLNRVIADQRALIKTHVGDPEQVPQLFNPYKEVLEVYLAGLELPADVTLVWPDDNFGYIRHFSTPAEQARSGRSGVYYHLSYLGAPLSYLWLSTTPPALVSEEMTRAFDSGADRFWIFNAGDIKPAELNLSHALDLAWDVQGVRQLSQQQYLTRLAGRLFGPANANAIGALLDRYYRFNFERRPEHLQYHLPKEPARASGLSAQAVERRLQAAQLLLADLAAIRKAIPPAQRSGFFQLVDYPVQAAALANQRFFALEAYAAQADRSSALAQHHAGRARSTDAAIKALTRTYNTGKWAGIMAEEPADDDWKSLRLLAPVLPSAANARDGALPSVKAPDDGVVRIEAEPHANPQWRLVESLGRGQGSLKALTAGAGIDLKVQLGRGGAWCVGVRVLPTYPAGDAKQWTLDVSIDGGASRALVFTRGKQDKLWTQGVLDNVLTAALAADLSAGQHTVKVVSQQAELMLDGLDLTPAPEQGCGG